MEESKICHLGKSYFLDLFQAETCASNLGANSKKVGSAMAQLLTAAAQVMKLIMFTHVFVLPLYQMMGPRPGGSVVSVLDS